MKLNKINVYNFVVYKKQTFDFKEMFEKDNILLIYGINKDDSSFANDNGAGKSLIKEIVLFLLFGRTSKNTSKNLLIGKFDKYANRYLAELQYRFNRRFDLAGMMPRLLRACTLTTAKPEKWLRSAEAWG